MTVRALSQVAQIASVTDAQVLAAMVLYRLQCRESKDATTDGFKRWNGSMGLLVNKGVADSGIGVDGGFVLDEEIEGFDVV